MSPAVCGIVKQTTHPKWTCIRGRNLACPRTQCRGIREGLPWSWDLRLYHGDPCHLHLVRRGAPRAPHWVGGGPAGSQDSCQCRDRRTRPKVPGRPHEEQQRGAPALAGCFSAGMVDSLIPTSSSSSNRGPRRPRTQLALSLQPQ